MKSVKIFLAAAVALLTVGCYNDFDTPKIKVWQEDEVAGMGLTHISILDLKKEFVNRFGSLSGTGKTRAGTTPRRSSWARPTRAKMSSRAREPHSGPRLPTTTSRAR